MLLPSFIPPCCGSGEEGGAYFKSRQEQNRCNAFVIRHLPDQKPTLTGQPCFTINRLNVTFILQIIAYKLLKLLLKIACVSLMKLLNLLRGQFWGRAALAPVILLRIRALLFSLHAKSILF